MYFFQITKFFHKIIRRFFHLINMMSVFFVYIVKSLSVLLILMNSKVVVKDFE